MKVEVYDKQKEMTLCTAEIEFGPGALYVEKLYETFIDDFHAPEDLDLFLTKRANAMVERSYEFDNVVLKKIGMENRRHLFGRMDEAKVLYALLCNFALPTDGILVYPLNDEVVGMTMIDPKYGDLYLWGKRR